MPILSKSQKIPKTNTRFSKPICKQHLLISLKKYFYSGATTKYQLYIRTVLSQKENSIHAVEDQSDYNFQENNGRVIQSNDLNEDFEGALLDLYKSLVIGGQLLFT